MKDQAAKFVSRITAASQGKCKNNSASVDDSLMASVAEKTDKVS